MAGDPPAAVAAPEAAVTAAQEACAAKEGASEVQLLRDDGYVVVRGALSPETCDLLREHVLCTTDEAARQGRKDLFGNIQEAESRYDLKLDMCLPVLQALNQFAGRLRPTLEEVVGGNLRIVELAAITSDGGAVAQPVHADTMHGVTRFLQSDISLPDHMREKGDDPDISDDEDADEDLHSIVKAVATDTALIFTSLIALQDVEPDMGPTLVWPRTNTVEHHATLWGTHVGGKLHTEEADRVFGVEHRQMTLKKGDLVLYDSRTMHCGGANTSDKRRSVLCVSVMGPGIRPDGTTWTMLHTLRNRLRLRDFPFLEDRASATAHVNGVEVLLPPPPAASAATGEAAQDKAAEGEAKPVPPLDDWEACVQCAFCGAWRPCSAEEAPRLTSLENGFRCPIIGFSCSQEQGYSTAEIDAIFG